MKQLRIWRSLLLALSAVGLAGCAADSLTAPRIQGDASAGLTTDLAGDLVKKDVLKRNTALAKDITVSATIGYEGGTISIPGAGLHLTVPTGAVKSNTKFTVTAIKGSLVAYEFSPHGIEFEKGLTALQDLSGTEWNALSLRTLVGGYFADRSALDFDGATALLSEVIAGVTSPLTKQFYFKIDHFSGYVVAW